MAAARVRESTGAVEVETARIGNVEAGVRIHRRILERHRDATDRIDQRLESAEVDLDVVVDGDPEVEVDGVDQLLRLIEAVRAVDPAFAVRAGDLDPQVSWQRQHCRTTGRGVDAHDHDRVAALTQRVARTDRVGGVRCVACAVVRAGDQEVACVWIGRWEGLGRGRGRVRRNGAVDRAR